LGCRIENAAALSIYRGSAYWGYVASGVFRKNVTAEPSPCHLTEEPSPVIRSLAMRSSGIGGQAVIEGVMMRYKNDIAVAVRKPDGDIVIGRQKTVTPKEKNKIFGWPVIRGVASFISSLVIGIRTLTFSASFFEEDEAADIGKKAASAQDAASAADPSLSEKSSKGESAMMFGTIALSLVLAVAIFMILPYYASTWIMKLFNSESGVLLAVVEGVLKLAIFIGYIALISLMKDIKRTFMYHGAEHKCINCIEGGKPLTVDNAMGSSREHRRCGTSFIFFVLFISIIFFMFLRFDNRFIRLGARLLLIPVIAGISYEFIQWAGNSDSKLASILSRPGMWIQKMTTREPEPDMVEVAIASVEAVFDWRGYLKEQGIEIPGEAEPADNKELSDNKEPEDNTEQTGNTEQLPVSDQPGEE